MLILPVSLYTFVPPVLFTFLSVLHLASQFVLHSRLPIWEVPAKIKVTTSAAQHSRRLSSTKNPPTQDQQEQFTATDAANFSRLGASLTTLPPDEVFKLPILPDFPEARASHVPSYEVSVNDRVQPGTEADDKTKSEL